MGQCCGYSKTDPKGTTIESSAGNSSSKHVKASKKIDNTLDVMTKEEDISVLQ